MTHVVFYSCVAAVVHCESYLQGLMCKDTVSVGWDGRIYDCDFNQQMGLGMGTAGTNTHAYGDLPTKVYTYMCMCTSLINIV
jgi:Protein of unknown function (DUF3641)